MNIIPKRYLRNIGTIGIDGQKKLLSSLVAVVGAGGLGGFIIELLARAGVGRITVIDGDLFEENNLNRQLLAIEKNIGKEKVQSAKERIATINSAVEVEAIFGFLTEEKGREILSSATVICDALDNISSRRILGRLSRRLGVPLVHGAVAGFIGEVTTIFPEDPGIELIYGEEDIDRGEEELVGNLPATVAAVASFQVQEVIKIITGRGKPLRKKLLIIDTESGTFETVDLVKGDRR
ncbi:MAG: HesA/MoeB/ThiF family protein [Acidobacteria bacterium]|nr:HesA/MoeB/ThiF family protein [Acidobacteriota bacterium]